MLTKDYDLMKITAAGFYLLRANLIEQVKIFGWYDYWLSYCGNEVEIKKEPFGTDLVDYPKMVLLYLLNNADNGFKSLFFCINPNGVAHELGQTLGVGINVFFEPVIMDVHQSQSG